MSSLLHKIISKRLFISILSTSKRPQLGAYLENIVFNELLSRGYVVSVGNLEKGENYLCKILEFREKTVLCEMIQKVESEAEPKNQIVVYQALPKQEKMEALAKEKKVQINYFISKALEIK